MDEYIEKLEKMGIEARAHDFVTSVNATILYLRAKKYKKIYALGTASFVEQLRQAGLPVTTRRDEGIDCLCMGFDTELTFQKIEDACILLLDDAVDYVATNPDWVCPTAYGCVPDCGSLSEMLYTAIKRRPKFIGKPEPDMARLAMETSGFSAEETVLIGDRLYTDIACGVNAGISTVFVLSGEGTMADLEISPEKPTYIKQNIKELYEDLVK